MLSIKPESAYQLRKSGLTSLNYAVLAGDAPGSLRVATLEVVSGVGFATAGAFLIYAIALTFDGVIHATGQGHADLASVGSFLRAFLATAMVPLLFLFIYLSVQDYKFAGGTSAVSAIDVLSWSLLAALLLIGTAFYRFHAQLGCPAWAGIKREKAIRIAAGFCLAFVLASSVSFALAAAILPVAAVDAPTYLPFVVIIVSFLAACGFIFHLARTRL